MPHSTISKPAGISEVLPSNLGFMLSPSLANSSKANSVQAKIDLQNAVDRQISSYSRNNNQASGDNTDDENPTETSGLTLRKAIMGFDRPFPTGIFSFTLQYIFYPFVGGVMGGFGEMLALEFGIWMGWGSAALFYIGRNPKP